MPPAPQDSLPDEPAPVSPTSGSGGPSHADEPTRVTTGSGGGAADGSGDIPLGPSIEGYVLLEELHRGGQGVVYRALQLGTKRQVALKVLLEGPFASETTRRRFEREIELAASLRHPHIVTILDSGLSRGRYFFAMEYIDGVRLDRYLAQRRPTLDATLLLFEQVCEAVNFAHQRGVIHRDLKPPNILVDADGAPHILDFGLAKPMHGLGSGDSTVQMLSTSGQLLGTVAYMSPEQAAGAQDLDVRTDVYSLGVVFYEALVGQPPYPVDGPLGEILNRIAHTEPANPRSHVGYVHADLKIDDELATILLKALEKEPQRRYQTAGDLARDLHRRLHGEPIEAKRASGLYMFKKALRRYRLQAAMAGLILLMLLGFLVTLAVLFTGERAARERADQKTEETRQAVLNQERALHEARKRTAEAMLAQQNLRHALVRQQIQRGDLALARGDIREARDSYWQALEVTPSPAAIWALRRYYLQTMDSSATLLTFEPQTRCSGVPLPAGRLAPSGRIAAVCDEPGVITLRALKPGAPEGWVRAPGPVTVFSVADDGSLAAAGDGWARVWQPGALLPAVAVELSDRTRPLATYPVDGGRSLLLLGARPVHLLSGATGDARQTVLLNGTPIGSADYQPQARQLAVPTTAGVELVSVAADGTLQVALAWTGDEPARAVRFDGQGQLAVLADGVYVADVGNAPHGNWTRILDAEPAWTLLDLQPRVATMVFAARDGQVAVYRNRERAFSWRATVDHVEQLSLSDDHRSVITLDDSGTVTHWIPPERVEQRRLVVDTAPKLWAAAADGSAVLMALSRGQVVAYAPPRRGLTGGTATPRTILRPRLLGLGGSMALAVNANGERAVIRERSTLRLVRLADLAGRVVVWNHPTLTVPDKVAISDEGDLVAVLARSPTGDRQQIAFRAWESGAGDEPAGRAARVPAPFEFGGALVREIAFLPRTQKLLIVRSNGHLLLLDPWRDAPQTATAPALVRSRYSRLPSTDPWLRLDAPATSLAFNRTGEYLAVACEDDILRLISVGRREIRHRIAIGQSVSALAFNPRDDVLLVRTVDGTVRLYDPATGEGLANWPLAAESEQPLAAWVGDDADAMLLGQDHRVFEYRYAAADAIIERNRAYARERRVAESLANANYADAWQAATELRELDAQRGSAVQLAVLDAALRRPNVEVPAAWIEAACPTMTEAPAAAARTCLRLGHAAYDGERYELARSWLRRGFDLTAEDESAAARAPSTTPLPAVDALTRLRLAQCDYLVGAYDEAAQGLAGVLRQPDLDPAGAPAAALQRVVALLRAGRTGEARRAALHIGDPDPFGRRSEVVATTYASVIARLLTGVERESAAAAVLDSLLASFGERPLLFQDDEHFFAGEMATQRGAPAEAVEHYQRCLDLARDEWPANWARYRLSQLTQNRAAAPDDSAAAPAPVPPR